MCFNKQENKKMKWSWSNQIFQPTFSNHVLKIDVDVIEKLIQCSLQGGPFGDPVCPPASSYYFFIQIRDSRFLQSHVVEGAIVLLKHREKFLGWWGVIIQIQWIHSKGRITKYAKIKNKTFFADASEANRKYSSHSS